jgi:hypothetical protein
MNEASLPFHIEENADKEANDVAGQAPGHLAGFSAGLSHMSFLPANNPQARHCDAGVA